MSDPITDLKQELLAAAERQHRQDAVPADRRIPRATITAAVRVIDCWLLSLGWPQVVYTPETFPWPDMLESLTCEMDSNIQPL